MVHSILEIVRGISNEGKNVEIRDCRTHNSIYCIHPSLLIVDLLCQFFSEKAQTKMQMSLGTGKGFSCCVHLILKSTVLVDQYMGLMNKKTVTQ